MVILSLSLFFRRRRQWHPTPILLPGKSHGWRSLVGCSPWGREESDTTERLHFHFSLSCTGEGNGNPLQCSCLENPRDGGAWWVAVYGVAQSWTRLKWLSSFSLRETIWRFGKQGVTWQPKTDFPLNRDGMYRSLWCGDKAKNKRNSRAKLFGWSHAAVVSRGSELDCNLVLWEFWWSRGDVV